MKQIDESSDGKEIELAVGENLDVSLDEVPSTGYQWNLEADGSPVCVLIDPSHKAPTNQLGQGGKHHWLFQATQPGMGTIKLTYRRSWEQNKPPAQTFTLRVRVVS